MRYVFTLFLLSYGIIASAQVRRNFITYDVNNGLAQNTVWDLFQDSRGYLWFGTADGVNRFDGYQMKHYVPHKGDSTSLGGNTVIHFYEDSRRRLWVSHNNGISLYNRERDCFKNIYLEDSSLYRGETYCIVIGEDTQGKMWFMGYNNLLFSFSDSIEKVVVPVLSGQYPTASNRKVFIAGKYIVGYLNDSSSVWFRFNTQTQEMVTQRGVIKSGWVMKQNDSLVYLFNEKSITYFDVKNNTLRTVSTKGYGPVNHGSSIGSAVSWQGKIWMGNDLGLFVLDEKTMTFEEQILSFDKMEDIGFFYVQNLKKDNAGNLWICTNGAGAKCLSQQNNKFKHYTTGKSRNALVKAITTRRDGSIYTGLYGQGIIEYAYDGSVRQNKFGKGEKALEHVLGMTIHNDQLYYSLNQKICRTDLKTGKTIWSANLQSPDFSLRYNIAYPVFRKWKNQLYVSADYAIYKISPTLSLQAVVLPMEFNKYITTFEIVNDTTWWIGTTKELFIYNPKTHVQRSLDINLYVKSICYSKQSNSIWAGGHNGLFLLSYEGRVIKQFGHTDGLPDDFVYGILEDQYNRLWMSHNKGLSVFNPSSQQFKHYTIQDGLQGNEFNTGAYYKDSAGLLYFGGVNGVSVIDPQNIPINNYVPQIGINEILLGDLPYQSETAYNEITQLKLSYLENTLSFDFSALEFSNPGCNTYKYKLDGYDKGWIESGTKHFVRYANLPPGKYVLEIMAANGDGVWNPHPRLLPIEIVPPFWERLWFYFLIGVLILGVIVAGVYWIIKRQEHRMKQELEVQHKLELERLRISRDLHDNVGAQLSFLITNMEWMLHNPEKLDSIESQKRLQTLSDAGRNAIVTLRQTIWAISHTELSVDDFSDRFKQYAIKLLEFEPKATVQFYEAFEGSRMLSPAQALNVFRICQEALSNCLKHAKCSLIVIRFTSNNQCLFEIVVEDNGIGLDWDQAKQKGHYGLVNMQARAEEAGASLVVKSNIGVGTSMIISLK